MDIEIWEIVKYHSHYLCDYLQYGLDLNCSHGKNINSVCRYDNCPIKREERNQDDVNLNFDEYYFGI